MILQYICISFCVRLCCERGGGAIRERRARPLSTVREIKYKLQKLDTGKKETKNLQRRGKDPKSTEHGCT